MQTGTPDYADSLLPLVRQSSLDLQFRQIRSPGQELVNGSWHLRQLRVKAMWARSDVGFEFVAIGQDYRARSPLPTASPTTQLSMSAFRPITSASPSAADAPGTVCDFRR